MRVITKSETQSHQNSDSCLVVGYPLEEPDFSGVVIKLTGRYPEKGWGMNKTCKLFAYILSGTGMIHVEGEDRKLSPGDLVFIPPGQKYYWDGTMEMFMPSTPAWSPEQYEVG